MSWEHSDPWAEIERLRAENERLRKAVERLEDALTAIAYFPGAAGGMAKQALKKP